MTDKIQRAHTTDLLPERDSCALNPCKQFPFIQLVVKTKSRLTPNDEIVYANCEKCTCSIEIY